MSLEAAAVIGGKAVGGGVALAAVLHFIRWLFVFACARLDKKQDNLDAMQERVDVSLAKRLAHLEEQEEVNRDRIQVLEEVATILIVEVRAIDPMNEKLHHVATMLRSSIPFAPRSPSIEETMNKLRGME